MYHFWHSTQFSAPACLCACLPVLVLVVHQEEDVQNYTQQITALEERRQVVTAVLAEKQSEHREAEKEFKEMEGKMEARANSDIPLKVSLSMLFFWWIFTLIFTMVACASKII